MDDIARGAAFGGHKEWAEALRREGAEINIIAGGAAFGGHKEWAEELRRDGANIASIAIGAIKGQHRSYVRYLEELMRKAKNPVQSSPEGIAVVPPVASSPSNLHLSGSASVIKAIMPPPSILAQQRNPQQEIAELRSQVQQLQSEKQAMDTVLASRDETIQLLRKDKQRLETDKQIMQQLIGFLQQSPQSPQAVIAVPASAPTLTTSPSFFQGAPEPQLFCPNKKAKTREEEHEVTYVGTNHEGNNLAALRFVALKSEPEDKEEARAKPY